MGTHAWVGVDNRDEGPTVDYIEVSYDGSTLGPLLRKHYGTEDQARRLISQGNASSIGPTVKQSEFYARDHGERLERGTTERSYFGDRDGLYYLFRDGAWFHKAYAGPWRKVGGKSDRRRAAKEEAAPKVRMSAKDFERLTAAAKGRRRVGQKGFLDEIVDTVKEFFR